jgi:uncharacterized cupin superfamily protein
MGAQQPTAQKFSVRDAPVEPTPLPREDVIDGDPVPSWADLWRSPDGEHFTGAWHCTPGAFFVVHPGNETFCIVEGRATVKFGDQEPLAIGPGDVVFVPGGTRARWEVHQTIRKGVAARASAG